MSMGVVGISAAYTLSGMPGTRDATAWVDKVRSCEVFDTQRLSEWDTLPLLDSRHPRGSNVIGRANVHNPCRRSYGRVFMQSAHLFLSVQVSVNSSLVNTSQRIRAPCVGVGYLGSRGATPHGCAQKEHR